MAISFIRTIVMYLFVIAALRLMGKRQIGELQPSELVVAIMISELAAIPIQDASKSLLSSLIGIVTLLVGEIVISFAAMKSNKARRFLSGKPSLLVAGGKINQKEMRRLRFNIGDMMEELRNMGFSGLSEVEYVIIETNGRVSIIPNSLHRPLTPQDMNMNPQKAELSYLVIDDGVVNAFNMKTLGFDEKWLQKQLAGKNIKNPADVFYMSADRSGSVFLVKKDRPKKKVAS